MAQFDVYLNLTSVSNPDIPYLLDVQSDLLDGLNTRVVVPLVLAEMMGQKIKYLSPQFKINDRQVVMSTAELAGLPTRALGAKVTNLSSKRNEIIAALNILFSGI